MTTDSKPGADKVARVAGIWRPIEMSDGDILKLFQSGKQSEKNYRQFDGEWYVLDESPEAIAEASGSVEMFTREQHQLDRNIIDRLTAEVAALKRQLAERADLLRPSSFIERESKRALIILSSWGDDAPADEKVRMAREILQKALASLTPVASKDDWCGWCRGRGERMLVATHAIGKCPDCDGTGTQQFKRGEHGKE